MHLNASYSILLFGFQSHFFYIHVRRLRELQKHVSNIFDYSGQSSTFLTYLLGQKPVNLIIDIKSYISRAYSLYYNALSCAYMI